MKRQNSFIINIEEIGSKMPKYEEKLIAYNGIDGATLLKLNTMGLKGWIVITIDIDSKTGIIIVTYRKRIKETIPLIIKNQIK